MAMTYVKILKVEKSFSLNDGEWTISAEMFNQGHGSVLQYSPVWLYVHTWHGWLPLRLVSWGKKTIYCVIGDNLAIVIQPRTYQVKCVTAQELRA